MTYENKLNVDVALSYLQQEVTNLRSENVTLRARVAEAEARAQAAEAENGRLRAALTALKRHCFKHHQGDDSCNCAEIDAALAAPAPETGEREAVAEALLQWAGEHYLRAWDMPICVYCGGTINASTSSGHKPDCLHLRAKALRAQAGGEGEG